MLMESCASSTLTGGSFAKLRIAGSWSGVIEVELEVWTLPMLRQAVAQRVVASADCVNLICGGKILRDGESEKSLAQMGIRDNAKVLATVLQGERGKEINNQAERVKKLERIQNAAKALVERHADGTLPEENYNIELEDQYGQKVMFGSEADKKALMMGLMLHTNGKSLIKKQMFKDALDVLYKGEEAFSLCDPRLTEIIDNVPLLQLDIVWCYFMLKDISCLSVAGMRLDKARKGFDRAHGKDTTRFRQLQGGYHADLAIYLRMELLEGVVAYHSGNFKEAQKALSSAQAKYVQLQVPDEALSLLMGMGYKENAAKRALRMTRQDVQLAVDFLVEERAKKMQRKQENLERHADILEQQGYGATPMNKPVDLQKLKELISIGFIWRSVITKDKTCPSCRTVKIGFERPLAAEALRVNENDTQKALDILTDPERNCALQSKLEKKKSRTSRLTDTDIEQLISMGYDRSSVMDAVAKSHTMDDALELLAGASSENQCAITNEAVDDKEGPSIGASNPDELDEGLEQKRCKYQRDVEMEDELAKDLTGDPFSDYDIDVSKEGEAIAEYLALLDSVASAR